ncbi:hypothetical protein M231_03885 [Tremella mesenterica]|uniref:Uncharacterized protein n=1 Tax=Tremella mesenterica TaxID=5217 RepID=A0A4Q1BLZ7_TREME|nr:hypothetical protein M231_03885 [Tremella mesenterica]
MSCNSCPHLPAGAQAEIRHLWAWNQLTRSCTDELNPLRVIALDTEPTSQVNTLEPQCHPKNRLAESIDGKVPTVTPAEAIRVASHYLTHADLVFMWSADSGIRALSIPAETIGMCHIVDAQDHPAMRALLQVPEAKAKLAEAFLYCFGCVHQAPERLTVRTLRGSFLRDWWPDGTIAPNSSKAELTGHDVIWDCLATMALGLLIHHWVSSDAHSGAHLPRPAGAGWAPMTKVGKNFPGAVIDASGPNVVIVGRYRLEGCLSACQFVQDVAGCEVIQVGQNQLMCRIYVRGGDHEACVEKLVCELSSPWTTLARAFSLQTCVFLADGLDVDQWFATSFEQACEVRQKQIESNDSSSAATWLRQKTSSGGGNNDDPTLTSLTLGSMTISSPKMMEPNSWSTPWCSPSINSAPMPTIKISTVRVPVGPLSVFASFSLSGLTLLDPDSLRRQPRQSSGGPAYVWRFVDSHPWSVPFGIRVATPKNLCDRPRLLVPPQNPPPATTSAPTASSPALAVTITHPLLTPSALAAQPTAVELPCVSIAIKPAEKTRVLQALQGIASDTSMTMLQREAAYQWHMVVARGPVP